MKELQKTSDADLQKLLSEKREAIRAIRFNIAGGRSKNVKETTNLKKEVARILTELSARTKVASK